MDSPVVDVNIAAYNHDKYIAQAIESVLMQKTTFPVRIMIGEDCSIDKTRDIVTTYADQYPDRIVPFYRPENLGVGKGRLTNGMVLLQDSTAKYVALLDGDDYWIDPFKLQKQVDFLESHPDFVTCFHRARILHDESIEARDITYQLPGNKPFYTVDDILMHGCFIPTCSAMFRNKPFGELPAWFNQIILGDFAYHVLNALHGKIGFLDETMAVYRVHQGGLGSTQSVAQILERTVETYGLLGIHLDLHHRASYRQGMAMMAIGLCHAYTARGDYCNAFVTGFRAFRIAPTPLKKDIVIHHKFPLFILYYTLYEGKRSIVRAFIQQLRVIRINGLHLLKRWCGERWYTRLKRIFHQII